MRRVLYSFGCLSVSGAVLALVLESAHGEIAGGLVTAAVLSVIGLALSVPFVLTSPMLPVVRLRHRRSFAVIGIAIPLAVYVGDKILTGMWMGVFALRGAGSASPTTVR